MASIIRNADQSLIHGEPHVLLLTRAKQINDLLVIIRLSSYPKSNCSDNISSNIAFAASVRVAYRPNQVV
jgi:hypothetical protein